MKAVVLETKDGYCAVLKDDGTVEKVKMVGEVGQEIDMPVRKERRGKISKFPLRYVAAAASVAFVAITSGYYSFVQDYSFVSMDVDASVEYSLNRMDRVVHVNAFDEKGETLAESVKQEGVEGNTLDEAVNKTADVLQRDGYVNENDEVVLVSVSSKDEKKGTKLKKRVKDTLDKDEVASAVEDLSMEEREVAKESGLSVPRYAVVKSIVGVENLDEATIEVAKAKSTSELLAIAEEIDGTAEEEAQESEGSVTEDSADDVEVCEEIHEDEPKDEEMESKDTEDSKTEEDSESEERNSESLDEKEDSFTENESTVEELDPAETIESNESEVEQQEIVQVTDTNEQKEENTEPRAVSPSSVPVIDNATPMSFVESPSYEGETVLADELDSPIEP